MLLRKLKTKVIVFAFAIILISMALMYRALMSQDAKSSQTYSSMPNLNGQKRPLRFHSKLKNFDIPNLEDTFRDNQGLNPNQMREEAIPFEFETVKDRDLLSADSKEALMKFLLHLYPTNWAKAEETDEVALELKYLLDDYGFGSKLSCKQIDSMKLGNPISFSRSKYIEYASDNFEEGGNYYNNYDSYGRKNGQGTSDIAIKSPSSDMDTKIACMKQIYDSDLCATMGNYKILREVFFLSTLHHPNILTLKGYCLRGNNIASKLQEKGLMVVTEVGVPFTHAVIYASTWKQRLSYALQASHLLMYLESSPFGSLRFTKLDMKDFVMVKGTRLKLADLDDLQVGQQACQDDSDCKLPNTDKGVRCENQVCEGYNSLNNLHLTAQGFLLPVLHNPPSSEDIILVREIQSLDITPAKLTAKLQMLYSNSAEKEKALVVVNPEPQQVINNRLDVVGMRQAGQNDGTANQVESAAQIQPVDHLSYFRREVMKNFAGIYDYQCEGSRISWGCVRTARSLEEAALMCLNDSRCQSFVTYTTRPESDNLMTVVLKNDSNSSPSMSSGTTLFIRLLPNEIEAEKGFGRREEEGQGQDGMERKDTLVEKSSAEIENCLERTYSSQESARYSREKRLMAHLGLKGIKEQTWRRSALRQNLGDHNRTVRAEGGGGKFLVNLTSRFEDQSLEAAKKATFIAEDGPNAYHVSYTLVYHLDRVLGLYHTPPCVGRQIKADTVERFHLSSNWEEIFRPLIESDGTLSGILVAPTPRVMKISKLTLAPLRAMTPDIVAFERTEKLQLEYVLLWWLGAMKKSSKDHMGYKGHLIHFSADKAFDYTSVNKSGFLYHCQFPSVVFRTMGCFKCEPHAGSKTPSSDVCSLGQEVVKRVKAMFVDDSDISVHGMTEKEIISYINSAATAIMRVVNSCIQTFGKENVLY